MDQYTMGKWRMCKKHIDFAFSWSLASSFTGLLVRSGGWFVLALGYYISSATYLWLTVLPCSR